MYQTFDDCCYIFHETELFNDKCTVNKILKLFLHYELQVNKRTKRQSHDFWSDVHQLRTPVQKDIDYTIMQDPMQIPPNEDFNYQEPYSQDTYFGDYYNDQLHQYSDNRENFPQDYYDNSYDNQQYRIESTGGNNRDSEFMIEQNRNFEETNISPPNDDLLSTTKFTPEADKDYFQINENVRSAGSQNLDLKEWSSKPLSIPNDFSTNVMEEALQNIETTRVIFEENVQNKTARMSNNSGISWDINPDLNNTHTEFAKVNNSQSRISQGNDFDIKTKLESFQSGTADTQGKLVNCFSPYPPPFTSPYRTPFDNNPMYPFPNIPQQQPLYVINPPMLPYIPVQYHNYGYQNSHMPQQPYFSNTNRIPMQITGPGGQYYICNPINPSTSAIAGLPGVEVRGSPDSFNLQQIWEGIPKDSDHRYFIRFAMTRVNTFR